MPSNKKYKLFSAQGDEKAPCAFFMSDKGCRNGDNCKFAHVAANLKVEDGADDKMVKARSIVETGSVVSSESEDFRAVEVPKALETKESEKKSKKRRCKSNDSPFAAPKKAKATPPTESKTLAPKSQTHTSEKKATKVKQEKPAEPMRDFRSLNLPVASFSLGSAESNAREKVQSVSEPKPKVEEPPVKNTTPLPTHTPTGRKWAKLVTKTREHHKYESEYNFERYMEASDAIGGKGTWVKAKPFGDWCKDNPQAICIDCEMCQTTDPVSGKYNPRALCRISIIDADTDEVLLDSLVKPEWPVTDYRSRINGITAEHLKDVEFTARHAQAFMTALCSEETIIMGHSVNNDLAALRMEHYCVVDSACLFDVAGDEKATIGLKDLSWAILKKDMPNTHDSVNDARVALRCLEYYLEHDGNVEPIARLAKKSDAAQLFIHRIPKKVEAEHLADFFLQHTSIAAEEVEDIVFTGNLGKTHVTFLSPRHANLAFATLEGKADTDATGRLQKKVFLRSGEYIRVRKMLKERENNNSGTKVTSP